MAWFCRKCDCFMLFNRKYCDDCDYDIWEREQAREEVKSKEKEKNRKKIRNEIEVYKKEQILQIENKYKTVISLKSDKVNIIAKNKNIQYEIDDLKKESEELKEAMYELEAIKNETLK